MTNLDRIKEWKRGCSNAYKDRPETCPECTRALIDAIENDLKEQAVIGAMPTKEVGMKRFTREELERMTISQPTAEVILSNGMPVDMLISSLARALLAEMDKPKVWTNAPDNAIIAQVHFYKAAKTYATPTAVPEVYTRELPKSRARVIAEEAWADCHSNMTTKEEDIARIESAILKALAEKEAGK